MFPTPVVAIPRLNLPCLQWKGNAESTSLPSPFSFALQSTMQQSNTEHSCTSFPDLPPHLQHHIFAIAAAPLTTCKASAAITSDASLAAQWLLVKQTQPLQHGIKHRLWSVCDRLLVTHQYRPNQTELCNALRRAAVYERAGIVGSLLQWCCKEHHQQCETCESLEYALLTATRQGYVPTVSLLAQHPAITAQHARDAVCSAAEHGQLQVMQALITSRPDASDPGVGGNPMYWAALHAQVPAMQLLLQHGADIHNIKGQPWSSGEAGLPLKGAAFSGQLEAVRWLLEQGVTDVEVGEALKEAVIGGHVSIVRYLLQECSRSINDHGPAALTAALQRGNPEAVCLLLEAGTPTDGPTFVQAAYRYLKCLDHYRPEAVDATLQAATQHGHTQFAEVLRELRAAQPSLKRLCSYLAQRLLQNLAAHGHTQLVDALRQLSAAPT
jgi:hypothetical protein